MNIKKEWLNGNDLHARIAELNVQFEKKDKERAVRIKELKKIHGESTFVERIEKLAKECKKKEKMNE